VTRSVSKELVGSGICAVTRPDAVAAILPRRLRTARTILSRTLSADDGSRLEFATSRRPGCSADGESVLLRRGSWLQSKLQSSQKPQLGGPVSDDNQARSDEGSNIDARSWPSEFQKFLREDLGGAVDAGVRLLLGENTSAAVYLYSNTTSCCIHISGRRASQVFGAEPSSLERRYDVTGSHVGKASFLILPFDHRRNCMVVRPVKKRFASGSKTALYRDSALLRRCPDFCHQYESSDAEYLVCSDEVNLSCLEMGTFRGLAEPYRQAHA
jgi:hypothetical protein